MTTNAALMTDADRADIERAKSLIAEGFALKKRVASRLRQRAWRKRNAKPK